MELADIMVYGCAFLTKDFNGLKKFVSNKQNPSGVLLKKQKNPSGEELSVGAILFIQSIG